MNGNPVGWFEIPVIDMKRAKDFYASAFELEFEMLEMGPCQMAMFPFDHAQPGCSGALVKGPEYQPAQGGMLIYFMCEEVSARLNKIQAAGGELVQEKMSIGEHGFIGLFTDSEGNKLGLHSRQ
ncbi:VOC family protein [Lacimicrobium alkaliphilum]|uniref:Glyoxalase n=1 Tax=Lacimicrobium alkaliphilum TaxID=1526571 RepID=A0A0U2PGF8_9ALTE|nr:VOC family protein [Lacimicrobium alkaliphilum]ALS98525.1 glyoxalase [Lacimicrobium alkaliphilum]